MSFSQNEGRFEVANCRRCYGVQSNGFDLVGLLDQRGP